MSHMEMHLEIDGSKTKLLKGGAGDPLLYLHSAGGETLWMPFHEELSKHFEVFAPAHPGFDSSEGLEKIDSMEDLVFHYLDFFDQMGWAQMDIVGLSLGGWIAAEFATRYPERVGKLILMDAAGLYVEGAPIAGLWEHSRDPEALRRLAFADPEGPIAQTLIQNPEDLSEEMMVLQLKAAKAAARVGWSPYLHNPKLRSRLHRIKAPTLILWGELDHLIPAAHARAYAEGIPNSKLVVIENCGHMPNMERLDTFTNEVVAFLKKTA